MLSLHWRCHVFGLATGAEVEYRHADSDAVGDLFENDAARGVGEGAVDFDAAIDGAGMHDDGIGFDPFRAGLIQTKHARVFADGREVPGSLALVLNAEQHDHIGIGEGGAQVVRDFHVERFEPPRYERGWSDDRHISPELGERVDVGTRDAAEENIAEDDNLAAFQTAEFLLHREHIEQRLGGMFVGTVTGIHDGDVEQLAQVERRTAGGVAQHDHIGVERLDVLRGVAEGFALGGAGGSGVEGDDIRAQELSRHLEGNTRARARLQEKIDDGFAAERRDLLDLAIKNAAEGTSRGEHLLNLAVIELFDGEEMFSMPGHVGR